MKKGVLIAVLLLFCLSYVIAEGEKIDISLIKENFSPGENISFKVSLLGKDSTLLQKEVVIIFQDAEKIYEINSVVESNKLIDFNLGEKAVSGYWKIIAKYNSYETNRIFSIETQELAKFEIDGDKLIITNIGNREYIKTIQIVIGNAIGTKEVSLDIGESTSFRLIAPDGNYNVRVSDGKTSISKENVALSGRAIGILDEKLLEKSAITSDLKPENIFVQNLKNNLVVYVFLLLVICAFILVIVERFYRKKVLGG